MEKLSLEKYFEFGKEKIVKKSDVKLNDPSNLDIEIVASSFELNLNDDTKNKNLIPSNLSITFQKEKNIALKDAKESFISFHGKMELMPSKENIFYSEEKGYKDGFYSQDFYEDIHSAFFNELFSALEKDYQVEHSIYFYTVGFSFHGKLLPR